MLASFARFTVRPAALALAGLFVAAASMAHAMGSDTPPDPCQQFASGTKDWKDCRRKNGLPTAGVEIIDRALVLGYALAKSGRYDEALAVLRPVEASQDPRVLTYIGFAERKLGHTAVAMRYYSRALAIAPDNVATLEYMGEAYVQIGDVTSARSTLARIASLCGTTCEAYQQLDLVIKGQAG